MSNGLTTKQQVFIIEYTRDFNATRAALAAGYSEKTAYSIGQQNLKKVEIANAIRARIDELTVGADEMLIGLSQQARASLGDFFKVVEEWTRWPLPTQEVIDAEDRVIDEESGEKATFYWVRHIALDLDKLIDPRYAPLVKKFGDSPKNGLTIELYDKQSAWRDIAKLRGLVTEKHEIKHDIDFSKLSNEQLNRIIEGEDVSDVVTDEG